MNKQEHFVSVQNAAAKTRLRPRTMPVTAIANAPSERIRVKMPKGSVAIPKHQTRRAMNQPVLVTRDRINSKQEEEQDNTLSMDGDEFADLTGYDYVMSLDSSPDGSCVEVTCITIDPTPAGTSSRDTTTTCDTSSPKDNRKPLERFLEQRQLIKAVRKRRVLYDSKNPRFHDRDFKNDVWRSIAKRLSMEMEDCVDMWTELRFKFQCHKRDMYNYNRKIAQRRPPGSRPFMLHEEEMLFMYPHVASDPLQREKSVVESVSAPGTGYAVLPVDTAQPVAIIDLDLDGDSFRITRDIRQLIRAVKAYPQLYDTTHSSYNDYRHRGLIWGAISNELREKATKLMKSWLVLQTRYEWEVNQAPDEASELMNLMIFLIPHMPQMKDSVYKTSQYLATAWHDPIEQFRSVMSLINMLKSNPELVQLTDEYLHHKAKPLVYHELWQKVAAQVMSTPQRCEVTWLVLRSFHSELVEMRLAGYKLQDKWFFESTITTIYRMVVERAVNREGQKKNLGRDPNMRSPMATVALLDSMTDDSQKSQKTAPRMPLAIVYPSAAVKAVFHTPTQIIVSSSSSNTSTAVTKTPTILISSSVSSSSSSSSSSSPTTTTTTTTTTTMAIATIATSSVSTSCLPSTGNDGLKCMNVSKMRVPIPSVSKTLKMTPRTVPAVQDGSPGSKVLVVRRSLPMPFQAPGYGIRPGATMATSVLSPAPAPASPAPASPALASASPASAPPPTAINLPTNPADVAGPPKTGKSTGTMTTTTSITPTKEAAATTIAAPSGALKRKRPSISGNGSSSIDSIGSQSSASENETETASESNDIQLPAIANTRLQMQIISNIKVEFLEDSIDGHSLHIYGGALTTRYTMNMMRVGTLIREVMAIPILHSSHPKLANKKSEFWGNVARKFHMPADACRAIWKFLSENISLFPVVAPMPELMGPHKGYYKNWEKSDRLFSKFEEVARKNQWSKVKDQLPLLMMHFRMYEHLYWDMRRPRPGEIPQSPRDYTQEERDDVWRVAKTRFPHINHQEVWSTFKYAFRTYMDDLEIGIENPWPRLWWTAFDQLRFLVNVRYHPLEPYYYIIHNKIREEVKRCSIFEKMIAPRPQSKFSGSQVRIDWEPLPWDTEEAKRLLTGKLRVDTILPKNPAPAPAASAAPSIAVTPALAAPPGSPQSLLRPRPIVLVPKGFNGTTMPDVKINGQQQLAAAVPTSPKVKCTTERHLPIISGFEVTNILRRYPNTYRRATTFEKRSAWMQASTELNASVTDCRLSLQHALRELLILKIADPKKQCQMGQNYYRHLNEIYTEVKPAAQPVSAGQLLVRTPQQLNQTLAEAAPMDKQWPKRFMPEISLSSCSPRLTLKNWSYAVGSFSPESQAKLIQKLSTMFAKHAQASKEAKARKESSKQNIHHV